MNCQVVKQDETTKRHVTCHYVVLTTDTCITGTRYSISLSMLQRKSSLVHSADLCRGRVRVRAVIDRYAI